MTLRHYKGGLYNPFMVATDSETGKEVLVYQSVETGKFWARPVEMFTPDRFKVTLWAEANNGSAAFTAGAEMTSKLGWTDELKWDGPQSQSTHDKVMAFINLMGASDPTAEVATAALLKVVYTEGNCLNFAKALKMLFPSAELVSAEDGLHVVCLIDGRYYDVTGEVFPKLLDAFNESHFELHNYCHEIGGPVI